MRTTPETVLLVEDEALVAMVAEDHLRFFGFEPVCVASAGEALAVLGDRAARPPSFAVIDVGLPDMRGDDFAANLRARSPNTKVILASGYDPLTLQRRFEDDPGVTVVSKPYSEDDLKRAILALGFSI